VFIGSSIETVDPLTGNLNVSIPLVGFTGRGLDATLTFYTNTQTWWEQDLPDGMTYWFVRDGAVAGTVSFPKMGWFEGSGGCRVPEEQGGCAHAYDAAIFHGDDGTSLYATAERVGTEYHRYTYSSDNSFVVADGDNHLFRFPDGTVVAGADPGDNYISDRNGNRISRTTTSTQNPGGPPFIYTFTTVFTDPLGHTATITSSYQTDTDIKYQDANGEERHITLKFITVLGEAPVDAAPSNYPYSLVLISDIILPDLSSYHFDYAQKSDGAYTGDIKKITLPTGGYYRYVYGFPPSGTGLNDSVVDRYVSSDGISEQHFHYDYSNVYPAPPKVTVSGPNGSTEYSYASFATPLGFTRTPYMPAEITTKDAANNKLQVVSNTIGFNTRNSDFSDPYGGGNPVVTDKTTLQDGAYSVAEHFDYDQYSNPTTHTTSGSDGSSRSTSMTAWVSDPSHSSYASPDVNLLRLPQAVTQSGSGGNSLTSTYSYDDNNGSPQGPRGNATSLQLSGANGGFRQNGTVYDSYGRATQTTDGRGYTTVNAYDDPNSDGPTKVTNPSTGGVAHIEHYSWEPSTGQMASHTDENGIVTNYSYNDPLGRISQITSAAGTPSEARTSFSYPTRTSTITTQDKISAGDGVITTRTDTDGFGRIIKSTQSDGSIVDTVYDVYDRVVAESNPHDATQPAKTDGVTSYLYDALGRVTNICLPDNVQTDPLTCQPSNSYRQFTYAGNHTSFKNENGSSWGRLFDVAGNLTAVVEPGNLTTTYQYDSLNNLGGASQAGNGNGNEGMRTRSFSYDSLSNLLTATNPENGIVCYGQWNSSGQCVGGYDANGNLLFKTDKRDITVSYHFDELNRLQSKTYSDGTPSACYQYDVAANGVGRLANQWTQPGNCPENADNIPSSAMSWTKITTYDPTGRLTDEIQCPVAPCAVPSPMHYGYDLAGNITHQGNGLANSQSPQVGWTNMYDSAGRLKQVQSDWTGLGHPATLFKADGTLSVAGVPFNAYGPFGLTAAQYGINEIDNSIAIAEKREYDNRGRLITKSVYGSNASTTAPTITTVAANPSTFASTSTTTIQVHVSCNSACGQVDIQVDSIDLGHQTLDANGNISVSSTSLPPSALIVGQHPLKAQYLGDTTHTPSLDQSSYTVLPSNQFLTLSVDPNAFTAGEDSKIRIHAACNLACGSVSLSVDNQYWRSWDLDSSGNLVLDSWIWRLQSPNFSDLGNHALIAHYAGNGTYGPADSNTVPYTIQNVGSQQITPTLDFSSYSFTSGENSHITIHHGCNSACGQIVLNVDQQFYRYLQLDNNGNASVDTFWWWSPLFTPATHTMVAQYLGNKTYAPTASQSRTFTINGTGTQQTTINLHVPDSFNPGSSSSVVSVSVGCNSACGVVQLTVDNQEWRDWALDSSGNISIDALHWPTPLLTPGPHTIKAHYYGNSTYAAVTSDPRSTTVVQFLTLTMSRDTFTAGENSVIHVHAGCSSACGQVSLTVDGQPWRSWDLDNSGNLNIDSWVWRLQSSNFSDIGQHTLVAHYSGNSSYASATSEGRPYTIQNPGTQPITPSLNMSSLAFTTGENSNILIHHDCNSACGQVLLTIDDNNYLVLQLDGSGNATVDTFWWWSPLFITGSHTMVAHYLGNDQYAAKDSPSKTFQIQDVGTQQAHATLSIPSSFNPANGAQITAHVDCDYACGVVQLTVDGNEWRDWVLDSNGTWSFDVRGWMTPLLSPGPHSIQAHYYGNGTYASANSTPPTQITVTQ
jgi:YD repeat-containing protein